MAAVARATGSPSGRRRGGGEAPGGGGMVVGKPVGAAARASWRHLWTVMVPAAGSPWGRRGDTRGHGRDMSSVVAGEGDGGGRRL